MHTNVSRNTRRALYMQHVFLGCFFIDKNKIIIKATKGFYLFQVSRADMSLAGR